MKTRRLFLKGIIAGIASFLFITWNKLTLNHISLKEQAARTLPFNKNKKVSFENDYIVVNNEKTTSVFSAHCTHLGCKINKVDDGHFVCPCHGSEYNMEGKVVKGPAYKNLKNLSFTISEDGKKITVES